MASLESMQAPASGLAYALEQIPRLSAQNSLSLNSLDKATARSEQQKAITSLLNQHDDSIFAYLRFARSLDQSFPGHGSLSNDQVLAVRLLSRYDDDEDEVRTLIGQARDTSSAPSQPQSSRPLRNVALEELGFAHLCPSEQTEGSFLSTLDPPDAHGHQTLDETKPSREITKSANRYWCTICEDPKSYKIPSDWKKHETGHVRSYVCMLDGPLEETEGGHKCILCGIFNPSEEHLDEHKVDTCGQRIHGSFTNKRRGRLVDHLMQCHNVQRTAQAKAIADKWQAMSHEQAWSCGFCAHRVHNFKERLSHIQKHFDRGQTLDEWDATKVMEGLLSQRGMDSAWKTLLAASSLDLLHPGIIWEKHLIKGIQHDLEMGPSDSKHAEVLAKAAYQASQSHGHSFINEQPFAFATVNALQRPGAVVPSSRFHSITEHDPLSHSNYALPQYLANPTEALHHDVFALDGTFPASSPASDNMLTEPSSAADHHTNFNGRQEHISAITDYQGWLTPLEPSNEIDVNDMWE